MEVLEWLIGANILAVVFGAGTVWATVRSNNTSIRDLRGDLHRHTQREDERAAATERWQRQMESRVGTLEGKTR
jgi:Sec-independent protein translocase protein TatA